MTTDLTKRAADMLLRGASLLGEPCPYCSGVRVMKDGHALCVGCGSEPRGGAAPGRGAAPPAGRAAGPGLRAVLEGKLAELSAELEGERDHGRQQEILGSINSALAALEKLGK